MHKLHWPRVSVYTYLRFCHQVRCATDEEKNEEFAVVVVDLAELEFDSADSGGEEIVDHCDD